MKSPQTPTGDTVLREAIMKIIDRYALDCLEDNERSIADSTYLVLQLFQAQQTVLVQRIRDELPLQLAKPPKGYETLEAPFEMWNGAVSEMRATLDKIVTDILGEK